MWDQMFHNLRNFDPVFLSNKKKRKKNLVKLYQQTYFDAIFEKTKHKWCFVKIKHKNLSNQHTTLNLGQIYQPKFKQKFFQDKQIYCQYWHTTNHYNNHFIYIIYNVQLIILIIQIITLLITIIIITTC